MKPKDLYHNAHLVVATIRILEHLNNAPPSLDEVARMLSFNVEHVQFICNRLKKTGIIDLVDSAFGIRLFIKDHCKIEEIPQTQQDIDLKKELKKFQDEKKDISKKIESLKTKQSNKQKNLFAELEKKLKKKMGKK